MAASDTSVMKKNMIVGHENYDNAINTFPKF